MDMRIEDLKEMRLLKQREIEWIDARITYLLQEKKCVCKQHTDILNIEK
jgi:hypothetical protein